MSNDVENPKNTHQTKLAIILVNWNGWHHTIECLESIFKNECEDFIAIVCDNASTDGSWEKIIDWAKGDEISCPTNDDMAPYSQPSCLKPLALKVIDKDGKATGDENAKLILIQTGANLGFAGGNNVGMRHALENSTCDYFWLLNNDTVITHDAIGHLITHLASSVNVGMCGTRIHFYHQPDTIQALGGAKYNKWTGTSKCIGSMKSVDIKMAEINKSMDFIVGASMILTRPLLDKVGLMEEKYFLYYEEIDWAMRIKGQFDLGYCDDVIVYHKEGGAIGSSSNKGGRSSTAEYFLMSSKIKFTKSFHPQLLPTIYIYAIAQITIRIFRGNLQQAKAILSALIGNKFKA